MACFHIVYLLIYFILIMSTIALGDLTKIKDITKTNRKTTSEYKIKEGPISVKYKLIVKSILLPKNCTKLRLLQSQVREAQDVKQINSIKEVFIEEEQRLIIVQEYQPRGDLYDYIEQKRQKLDYKILSNIAQGLRQIHNKNFLHLNLKLQNILITSNGIKFTDFQIAYISGIQRKNGFGGIDSIYTPPESKQYSIKGSQWDIWALGIIFLQLALQRQLQSFSTEIRVLRNIIETIKDVKIKKILKGMICLREQRFTINQVIKMLEANDLNDEIQSPSIYTYLRLPLFTSKTLRITQMVERCECFSVKIGKWFPTFNLIHTSSKMFLWLTASHQVKNIQACINILYDELPTYIQRSYSSWKEVYDQIQEAKQQCFSFQRDGTLCIKLKEKNREKQNYMPLVKCEEINQKQIMSGKILPNEQQSQQMFKKQQFNKKQKKDFLDSSDQKDKSHHMNKSKSPSIADQSQSLIIEDVDLKLNSGTQVDTLTAYRQFPKPTKKIEEIIQTLQVITNIQNQQNDLILLSYEDLGDNYDDNGDFEQAQKAYKIARQGYMRRFGENSQKQMSLLINLGNVYAKLRNYQNAIKCFKKSIFISERLQDDQITCSIGYKNLGNIAFHTKEYQTAEKCYKKFIEISQNNSQLQIQQRCTVYANLSNLYLKTQKFAKSNDCIEKYMALSEKKKGEKIGVLNFNWGFGLIHLNQLKIGLQKIFLSQSEKYNEKMRSRLEQILLKALNEKRELIKQQYKIHKQMLNKIKASFLPKSQKNLETLLAGMT